MTSGSAPPLVRGETEIVNRTKLLRRQIHPDQVRGDKEITTAVFWAGNDMVSTYQESVVSAAQAHKIHTQQFGLKTRGSCVVSVGDVNDAELRAVDDSARDNVHASHAYIDMRGLEEKEKDKARKKLKWAALRNPIWYPP